jgi:hypothetical protein
MAAWQSLAPVGSSGARKNSYPHKNSTNSNIKVVQFQDTSKEKEKETFEITDHPQEVWPFLETGRTQKTFDTICELGKGGGGTVCKAKHKLDGRIYALKKVKVHL